MKSPFFIVSAQKAELTPAANAARADEMARLLTASGLTWERVRGVWDGCIEDSFLVLATSTEGPEFETVRNLAQDFDQVCFLSVDSARIVALEFVSGDLEIIGKFQVLPDGAELPQNYTIDKDGTVYVTGW